MCCNYTKNLFSQNDLRSCVKKAYKQEKLPKHRRYCIPQFKSMTLIPLSSYNDATKLLFMAAVEHFVSSEGLQRPLPRGTKHSSLKRGAPIVLDASTQNLSHYNWGFFVMWTLKGSPWSLLHEWTQSQKISTTALWVALDQRWTINFPRGPHEKLGLFWRTAPINLQRDKINTEHNWV